MIGQLRSTVFDTREPAKLARFYIGLVGGSVTDEDPTWVTVTTPSGARLAFQYSPDHRPPEFPDPKGSQQVHLDIRVDDPDEAERRVVELGATRVHDAVDETNFRVFRDPAGHTFCLVWGIQD